MKLFPTLFFLLVFSALQLSAQDKPRILISSDIGGTDPDDNQSMLHLFMYSDLFNIEGLVSSPSFGDGSKEEILRMIDIYEKDYPTLKKHNKLLPKPNQLRKLCKQGRTELAPYQGFATQTEGSKWIVKCAIKKSDQPLWILVWGGLEDLAQALHDKPEIQNNIKVYWIGGPNKKWSVNSYTYIAENFPNLWMIEANATYRGIIANNKSGKFNRDYYNECIRGAGNIGDDFINYYKGSVKMGDTPSLLYVMNGDPHDPTGESWGGSFESLSFSPKTVFDRHTTLQDTVAVYSVIEFHFPGPKTDMPIGQECFTLTTDKQDWTGVYMGDGIYAVRYAPKAPATLDYVITSDISELNGKKGWFVVSDSWPGEESPTGIKLGSNWYTDKGDKQLYDGIWQGSKTVSKWRNDVLLDWEKRLNWLK